jgi:hypothetical protein
MIEIVMSTPVRHEDAAFKPKSHAPASLPAEPIAVGLHAAIFAMREDEPVVAIIPAVRGERVGDGALPCGPFSPREHKTLEAGLLSSVLRQTGIELAAARQLCTVGDRVGLNHGLAQPAADAPANIAVCYLALVPPARLGGHGNALWRSWYAYLPWEDWRQGKPECLARDIEPRLMVWARSASPPCAARALHDVVDRSERLRIAFGLDGAAWDEEKVLERYELLCEAGLIGSNAGAAAQPASFLARLPSLRHPLIGEQGRLLANAIGELRRRIKWQPVIFELMADTFTLFELQKTVEAILGPHLHKQNFRRLVEAGGLVEPTGEHRFRTGGRPARLYRFRRHVLLERLAPGVRVKVGRA